MTKDQVVKEISKRLGDPDAVAFADRIWGYFIEALYELAPTLSKMEQINFTARDIGKLLTNATGLAHTIHANQHNWTEIVSFKIDGIPAREIDQAEFSMMLQNSLYSISDSEYYYYFDGKQIILLSGKAQYELPYEVNYKPDVYAILADVNDKERLEYKVPNQTIYKALPLAVAKIKQEVGLLT